MDVKAMEMIIIQPMSSWMTWCKSATDRLSATLTRRQTAGWTSRNRTFN
jgi:hypothetical protein